MSKSHLLLACFALAILSACSEAPEPSPSTQPVAEALSAQESRLEPTVKETSSDFPTRVLWGDTHLHTSNSFDAYLFGTVSATADTAYRFAKGEKVISPTTGEEWQLSAPLDFLVIADHAESLGAAVGVFQGDPNFADTPSGKAFLDLAPDRTPEQLQEIYDQVTLKGSGLGDQASLDLTNEQMYWDLHGGEKRRTVWNKVIDDAEAHNDPGTFTSLIGWEWTAQPGGANLHRVIFLAQGKDVAGQFLPYSTLESVHPGDLWNWLGKTSERTGADFVAIPHNPNLSAGLFFPTQTLAGEPIDADYARTRMLWEPVVEVTQIKGDSETHPLLSPTDEYADFETYSFVLLPGAKNPKPTEADYARSGLRRGLEMQASIGVNPYKFGMIGSTDAHTGISAVEENNFAGKGQHDATPEKRPNLTGLGSSRGWDMGSGGFAGVWATENSREAIVEAFKRKEVYATTGPRITVRFFGGYDFTDEDVGANDIAETGYAKGVPMGSDLAPSDGTPTFLVAAIKDPNEANLDRIQVVKGWLQPDGSTAEKIYDVALSDGRKDGSEPVGNSVDLATGSYTNDIGDSHLVAVWEDPDFDDTQHAFYYARVLQIPTPRYSLLNAIYLGIDVAETNRPATIQERAYSSPIWYSP